jgi:hypothetical protein
VDDLLEVPVAEVAVLDIADKALDVARARLGCRASRVTWLCADITTFEPARTFTHWHDRAVIHFLAEPAQVRATPRPWRARWSR